MFKKDLQDRVKRIFGVSKTTFNLVDFAAPEQDCLFIEITDAKSRPYSKDRISARVTGALKLYAKYEAATYGFFPKRIEQSAPADRARFIFGQEENVPVVSADGLTLIQNLRETRVSFTFLYDSQYDPDRGVINELDLTLEMET